jgi:hypothetical protein
MAGKKNQIIQQDDDSYQRQGYIVKSLPCIESAQVEVSEFVGLVIFILNILSAGLGTFISGFIDNRGINFAAIILGIIQTLLAAFLIGWIWGVWHGYCVYKYAKLRS